MSFFKKPPRADGELDAFLMVRLECIPILDFGHERVSKLITIAPKIICTMVATSSSTCVRNLCVSLVHQKISHQRCKTRQRKGGAFG